MAGSWTARRNDYNQITRRHFARKNSVQPEVPGTPAETSSMPWSWRVGRFAGIDVYIHATFLILLAWLFMSHMRAGSTPLETVVGIGFVLTLFLCVVLHEYGHALAARQYGVKTRDITLLPIGGVARLERIPREPYQELIVALAGPAVNVWIAGMIFAVLYFTGNPYQGWEETTSLGVSNNMLGQLMHINLTLAIFNMLPAFPMDGGRVLRALLSMKIPRVRATQVASYLGQAIAIIFAIIGLTVPGAPFLLFIALFVFLGASQEYRTIRWESAVEGLSARDAMVTNFRTLVAEDPLSRAVTLLLQGTQHDFPVLDSNFRVVGLLLRQDLIAALSKDGGSHMPVSSAMRPDFPTASPEEPLVQAFERMQSGQLPILPVFGEENGRLLGLLSMENVAEVIMVRNAMEKAAAEHDSRLPA